ncbi:MAG: extensin [Thermoplasmata archaeon]|nr:MAG: extensin [Thermoplasmata archaeon]HEC89399.1 DEAD/DEAH box helicase [Thermoplasmatales archaeon]
MNVDEIPIDPKILDLFHSQGITKLYPPQKEAMSYILDKKNVLLSIPTASGKTLVAYIAILNRLLSEDGKALYVVPLIALAREKYEELQLFKQVGLKIGISTGDYDESDPHLSRYDIIVCTSEKADSLLRHGVKWIKKVKVLVVDEIHLIHDPDRGPTLEVLIARFRALNPDTQIIGLSATIRNADELGRWLNAEVIHSEWRPVILREGIYCRGYITYRDGEIKEIPGSERNPILRLVSQSLDNNGQVLVFVNTRRSTVSVAQHLGKIVEKTLSKEEKKLLEDISSSLKEQTEQTSIDKILSRCIKQGVAFHHAGLSSFQRRLVEKNFKKRIIKCVVATPTLAAGVNIPAQRVIIRDLWRYDPLYGMVPIPVLEYKQQAGRAGRPQYDKYGEAITIAKDENAKEEILNSYIYGEVEPIYSKLGSRASLRTHLLAAISTGFVNNIEDIYRFIESTFYACQSNPFTLRDLIDEAITFLEKNEFILSDGDIFKPTLFGRQTSFLYVDPMSALTIRKGLENIETQEISELSFLHIVCSTPDVRSLYLRRNDEWVEETLDQYRDSLLVEVPSPWEDEYEWFLSDLKTALLILDWIEEKTEDELVNKYGVGPGDIHSIIETVQWILHATREFARLYNFSYVSFLNDLIMRVRYGCKKELLNLVSLKGIGRVRARALFNEGFKTINDLRAVPISRLAEIPTIGHGIAKSIKQQLNEIKQGETNVEEYYR